MEVVHDSQWKAFYTKYDNGTRSDEILVRLADYWWKDARRAEMREKNVISS